MTDYYTYPNVCAALFIKAEWQNIYPSFTLFFKAPLWNIRPQRPDGIKSAIWHSVTFLTRHMHLQNCAEPQTNGTRPARHPNVCPSAPKWHTSFTNYFYHCLWNISTFDFHCWISTKLRNVVRNERAVVEIFADKIVVLRFCGGGIVFRNYGPNPSLGLMTSLRIAMTGGDRCCIV